jgi:hypothetical protein
MARSTVRRYPMESDTNPVTDFVDEFQIKGEEMLAKIRELVHEGNVRRIIIENADGKTVLEVPLTVGVVGALLLPTAAAIGAVAALVTDCTIRVFRQEGPASDAPSVVGDATADEAEGNGAEGDVPAPAGSEGEG